MSFKSLTEGG